MSNCNITNDEKAKEIIYQDILSIISFLVANTVRKTFKIVRGYSKSMSIAYREGVGQNDDKV